MERRERLAKDAHRKSASRLTEAREVRKKERTAAKASAKAARIAAQTRLKEAIDRLKAEQKQRGKERISNNFPTSVFFLPSPLLYMA